jgi:tetratricopeptide (TPR) repeat protein
MAKGKAKQASGSSKNRAALIEGCRNARALLDEGDLEEAIDALNTLAAAYPNSIAVRQLQYAAARESEDVQQIAICGERLAELEPRNADLQWDLALAHSKLGMIALPAQALRRLLEFSPDHANAGKAREMLDAINADMREVWAEGGEFGKEGFANMVLHERMQLALALHEHDEAESIGHDLLKRLPEFTPALNNMALAHWYRERSDEAVDWSNRALAIDPNNVQALGELTRMHLLLGRVDEARAYAERLKAAPRADAGKTTKLAESLSYLGDDTAIIAAFEDDERRKPIDTDKYPGLIHFAAVAYARTGQTERALALWRSIQPSALSYPAARENLRQFETLTANERTAPYAHEFSYWVRRNELNTLYTATKHAKGDAQVRERVNVFLQKHPHFLALLPFLLRYGDDGARRMAMMLINVSESPVALRHLVEFATDKIGPHKARIDALMSARRLDKGLGLLPDGPVQFWHNGAWTQVESQGFELVSDDSDAREVDPESPLARALDLADEAIDAKDFAEAERQLRIALDIEPDEWRWQKMLANVLSVSDRDDEAQAIWLNILEKDPDNLVAKAERAIALSEMGEHDEAKAMLPTMARRRRIARHEFRALVRANALVLGADGDMQAADSWIRQLEAVEPESQEARILRGWISGHLADLA